MAWKIFAVLNIFLGLCEAFFIMLGNVEITAWLVITDIFSVLGTFFLVLYAFGFSLFPRSIRKGFAIALTFFVLAEAVYLLWDVYDAHLRADAGGVVAAWIALILVVGLSILTLIAVWRYSREEVAHAEQA